VKVDVVNNRISQSVPDGTYSLTKPKKTRSLNQNNYLWGIVYQTIADELGYSVSEIHEYMKARFLPHEGKLEIPRSTTSLSTVEMEDYLSKIRIFASSELDIFIQLPNETDIYN
jgi:hypothetical protein